MHFGHISWMDGNPPSCRSRGRHLTQTVYTPRWRWVPRRDNACWVTTQTAQELPKEPDKELQVSMYPWVGWTWPDTVWRLILRTLVITSWGHVTPTAEEDRLRKKRTLLPGLLSATLSITAVTTSTRPITAGTNASRLRRAAEFPAPPITSSDCTNQRSFSLWAVRGERKPHRSGGSIIAATISTGVRETNLSSEKEFAKHVSKKVSLTKLRVSPRTRWCCTTSSRKQDCCHWGPWL